MAVKRSAQQNPAEGNDDRPRLEASRTQIRWLIRRDMDDVLAIERASFQFPWTEEEFLCCLRQRNCIGTVAELDHRIAMSFLVLGMAASEPIAIDDASIDAVGRWCGGAGLAGRARASRDHDAWRRGRGHGRPRGSGRRCRRGAHGVVAGSRVPASGTSPDPLRCTASAGGPH